MDINIGDQIMFTCGEYMQHGVHSIHRAKEGFNLYEQQKLWKNELSHDICMNQNKKDFVEFLLENNLIFEIEYIECQISSKGVEYVQ
jgi:hypothetical protein